MHTPARPCLLAALASLAAAGSQVAPLRAQARPERRVIRKITIEGLRRTPESELLPKLRIRLGEVLDEGLADREAGRLYTLGDFQLVRGPFIEPFEDGVAVRYAVTEKPLVRRVLLLGRSELSESTLKEELKTQEGKAYNTYWVQQDEDRIRDKYHEEGYLTTEVTHRVGTSPEGVTVSFLISEGARIRIRRIQFTGNRAFSSGALLDLMTTREKDFWFFGLLRPGFLDYDTLQRDLLTVSQYYRRSGYLDVRVEVERVELDSRRERMDLTIRVDEGPQYIFRGYLFEGNAVFSSRTLAELTQAPLGRPFNAEAIERDREAVKDYYGDRAYIFASVDWQPVPVLDRPEVRVRFIIREGNEIYIDQIRIRGNDQTQDRVIRRELEIYPGERVDHSKLVKSRSNLARLGIFRDITYDYESASSEARRHLVVGIEEEQSGQLAVGFGVTSGFGIIGNLNLTKRNFDITDPPESIYDIPDSFTGAGQTFNLVAQPGTRRSFYRLTFIEPYLFETRNMLTLSASSLDLIREDWEESRARFAPSVAHSFDFDRDFQVSLGARLENTKVTDVEDDAPDDVFRSEGSTSVIALGTQLSYDKIFYNPDEGPYDGHRELLSYEYGGGVLGGNLDFHKTEVTSQFLFPVYTLKEDNLNHIISVANNFGWIEPHSGNEFIPVFERFFLGGAQTVRGFRFRGLGPQERRTPTGGTAMFYGNLEYSLPLFATRRPRFMLRAVAFLDHGNLSPDIATFTVDETRIAAGGGLRIFFPFLGGRPLPIGLFFGVPILKEDGDRPRLFLFSIGTPF